MANSKIFWELGRVPTFQPSFLSLSRYEQWVVKNTINGISHYRNPIRVYQNTPCAECISGVYVFGILKDGIGHEIKTKDLF